MPRQTALSPRRPSDVSLAHCPCSRPQAVPEKSAPAEVVPVSKHSICWRRPLTLQIREQVLQILVTAPWQVLQSQNTRSGPSRPPLGSPGRESGKPVQPQRGRASAPSPWPPGTCRPPSSPHARCVASMPLPPCPSSPMAWHCRSAHKTNARIGAWRRDDGLHSVSRGRTMAAEGAVPAGSAAAAAGGSPGLAAVAAAQKGFLVCPRSTSPSCSRTSPPSFRALDAAEALQIRPGAAQPRATEGVWLSDKSARQLAYEQPAVTGAPGSVTQVLETLVA
mmetsp:Transcript_85935/g.277528  ORF Transcript_85935/g.277528 Transcript_85935/m.277528 type:complete len:278 (+) Transcript_85935:2605-3438(+)